MKDFINYEDRLVLQEDTDSLHALEVMNDFFYEEEVIKEECKWEWDTN